jgi:diguanylate cyclase (GGDEF)-like protein
LDFEPERPDQGERPDGWTDDGEPDPLRSLMFHSTDDLPWPDGEPGGFDRSNEADLPPAAGIPIRPDDPAVHGDPDVTQEDAMDTTAMPNGTPAPGDPNATTRRGPVAPSAPTGWSDTITSTDGPHYWDRLMSSERDRVRRYRRPATIVFLEVDHLDRLARLWGDEVAAQSLVRIGRAVMREIRSSDHCARVDVGRFAVFLPETDEIAAINFVERARASIEEALGLMADTITVGIGWASPSDGDLDVALELAEARLTADLAANG